MKPVLFLLASSVLASHAASVVGYAGGTYQQNFNTLQNNVVFANYTTLPGGWEVSHGSYVWTNGTTGYSNNYGTYAFSSSSGAPDKSLGLVIGSTGQAYMGVRFHNTTGGVLRSFTLSYHAEQWGVGNVVGSNQSIPFNYSLGATSLTSGNYVTVAALAMNSIHDGNGTFATLNGDLGQNRTLVFHTVTGINWQPDQDLWLRWDGVSLPFFSSHVMAVDDLSFSAIPEPSTGILAICGLVVAVGFFRNRRS
jgi:hypothetical protein